MSARGAREFRTRGGLAPATRVRVFVFRSALQTPLLAAEPGTQLEFENIGLDGFLVWPGKVWGVRAVEIPVRLFQLD